MKINPEHKPKQELSVKKKKQIEHKYIGSVSPFRGHKVFEVNEVTGEIQEASYVKSKNIEWEVAVKSMEAGFKREIVINQSCVYISALNKESALKRYKSGKGSALSISNPSPMKMGF
jgi:hypothetical protein